MYYIVTESGKVIDGPYTFYGTAEYYAHGDYFILRETDCNKEKLADYQMQEELNRIKMKKETKRKPND